MMNTQKEIGFYVVPRACVNGIHFERHITTSILDYTWVITPKSAQRIMDEAEDDHDGLEKINAIQVQYAPGLESQWREFARHHAESLISWAL